MTIREIKHLHEAAKAHAWDYIFDGVVRQWMFNDGSMLQCAVDYSWFAVYPAVPKNDHLPTIARMY